MKQSIVVFFLFIFSLQVLNGQGRKIEFDEFKLDNGLHVILHQDNSTPIVVVSIMYHVGSKNEDPDRTGFAHFFEHLMFEGTENIARGDYFKMIQSAGGTLNANTSFDRTYYYQILPSNQLELGLYMESERLLHAKIDSAGVETQRKVVKEERKQSYDNQPYGSFLEKMFGSAYKVHPYRWTPIGSVQYIDEAKIEEFVDFYKHYYVPQNATLSITGDIDKEKTKQLVEKYFGEIPARKDALGNPAVIERPNIKEPKRTEEFRDIVYDNIQLPGVFQGYHIPAQGTEDYYAINMLTTLLSGGQSSRLYKTLIDKEQKAVAVAALPLALEDPGLFLVYGIANVGVNAEDVEALMNVEIEKAQNELISDYEFEKLRNQIENDFVKGNSSLAGIAENLSNYHVYFGDADLINTEIDRYMKVTKEDIQRVAKEYLNKNNRVVLYYLPKSQKPTEEGN